jgi:hypothetical protein
LFAVLRRLEQPIHDPLVSVRRTYTLEVGAVTDSVTVTGEVPLVNTLSPEQRLNLDLVQVASLPMTNRNIASIIEYSGTGLTKTDPKLSSGFGGTRFRMNGLGGAAMSATADGGDASGFASTSMLGSYGGFAKIEIMSAELSDSSAFARISGRRPCSVHWKVRLLQK